MLYNSENWVREGKPCCIRSSTEFIPEKYKQIYLEKVEVLTASHKKTDAGLLLKIFIIYRMTD